MNTLKEMPKVGERFIVGRKTSRRVGILADSTAVVNGRTIATAGITIAFNAADNLMWDSAKPFDASGRLLTADEVEIVRQWAVRTVPVFPDMWFVPVEEEKQVREILQAEKAKEESRYKVGTRTSETVAHKAKR